MISLEKLLRLKLNGCVCVKWVFSPPAHPVSLLVGEPEGGEVMLLRGRPFPALETWVSPPTTHE